MESIATLLREASQFKKELTQRKKSEAHAGVLKKLYVISEENRRLRMENLRLKSELGGASEPRESKGNDQRAAALERDNLSLRRQLAKMQEIVSSILCYRE